MTTTNNILETTDVRALTDTEIGDVGGGSISFGTWLRRLAWQLQNAPENATLIECSDDMSTCTYQSN